MRQENGKGANFENLPSHTISQRIPFPEGVSWPLPGRWILRQAPGGNPARCVAVAMIGNSKVNIRCHASRSPAVKTTGRARGKEGTRESKGTTTNRPIDATAAMRCRIITFARDSWYTDGRTTHRREEETSHRPRRSAARRYK